MHYFFFLALSENFCNKSPQFCDNGICCSLSDETNQNIFIVSKCQVWMATLLVVQLCQKILVPLEVKVNNINIFLKVSTITFVNTNNLRLMFINFFKYCGQFYIFSTINRWKWKRWLFVIIQVIFITNPVY